MNYRLSFPFIVGVFSMLFLFSTVVGAMTPTPTEITRNELTQISDTLNTDALTLNAEDATLKLLSKNLTQKSSTLVREKKSWEVTSRNLKREYNNLQIDLSVRKRACGGTYTDQAEYLRVKRACEASFRVWNQKKDSYNLKINTSNSKRSSLVQRQNTLSADVLALTANQKKYNGKVEDWWTRQHAWITRVNLFFSSSALDDLRRRAIIGKGCAHIKDAMTASACLHKIWSGSR